MDQATKVFIFGHQTLLNPELLRNLCEKASNSRQTTSVYTD